MKHMLVEIFVDAHFFVDGLPGWKDQERPILFYLSIKWQ